MYPAIVAETEVRSSKTTRLKEEGAFVPQYGEYLWRIGSEIIWVDHGDQSIGGGALWQRTKSKGGGSKGEHWEFIQAPLGILSFVRCPALSISGIVTYL